MWVKWLFKLHALSGSKRCVLFPEGVIKAQNTSGPLPPADLYMVGRPSHSQLKRMGRDGLESSKAPSQLWPPNSPPSCAVAAVLESPRRGQPCLSPRLGLHRATLANLFCSEKVYVNVSRFCVLISHCIIVHKEITNSRTTM